MRPLPEPAASRDATQHPAVVGSVIAVQAHTMEGPIPPAEMLAAYDNVMPGLAGRIVAMAEAEQQHRHRMDRTEAEQPFILARRGQTFGLTAMIAFLTFAGFLALRGATVAAAILAAVDIVAILVVFITGQAPVAKKTSDEPKDRGEERSSTAMPD